MLLQILLSKENAVKHYEKQFYREVKKDVIFLRILEADINFHFKYKILIKHLMHISSNNFVLEIFKLSTLTIM